MVILANQKAKRMKSGKRLRKSKLVAILKGVFVLLRSIIEKLKRSTKNMDKTIILNAGHSLTDPGACYHGTKEADEVRKIRDKLVPLLKKQFKVIVIPDNLGLKESIKWANKQAPSLESGLAFSIHLNACGNCGARGAETYFYGGSKESEAIAKKIIDKYCLITGFKNRGAKSDISTRWGRLGWIRDTSCWSCLIECCFIDSKPDLDKLKKDYQKVAQGIYEGICSAYNIKSEQESKPEPEVDKKSLALEEIVKVLKKYKII